MSQKVRAARPADLLAILQLQRENLERAVGPDEARGQGFVTVVHDEETLLRLHALSPAVVAEDGEALVGYALSMTVEAAELVPALRPMFEALENLRLPRFYVMGQICVAKTHRGRGVFDALYAGHRDLYSSRFEAVVTEISARNARSLRAHARVGFEKVHAYRDALDQWVVVAWRFPLTK